jgi:hypothetical protein
LILKDYNKPPREGMLLKKVQCSVCKQFIELEKGDEIVLCEVDSHTTKYDVEKIISNESSKTDDDIPLDAAT